MSDLENISSSDKFDLTINRREREFRFQLKQALDPVHYQQLWKCVLHRNVLPRGSNPEHTLALVIAPALKLTDRARGGRIVLRRSGSAFFQLHQHLFFAVNQRRGVIAGQFEAVAMRDRIRGQASTQKPQKMQRL